MQDIAPIQQIPVSHKLQWSNLLPILEEKKKKMNRKNPQKSDSTKHRY